MGGVVMKIFGIIAIVALFINILSDVANNEKVVSKEELIAFKICVMICWILNITHRLY